MGQVAFDTQEFVETLENAGLPKDQAKAISIAVRKSHEVADVATKRDLEDVHKDLTVQIADVRKDMDARFEKHEAQIADVRKDLLAEIADVRKDMANRFDKLGLQMTVRMGGMLIAAVGLMTAILKVLK